MMEYKFEKLEVWNLSVELLDLLYLIANRLPRCEEYNLKSQLIRSGTSISLNIAEGSTVTTNPEQIRYLRIALHSLVEVVACLKIIQHREYFKDLMVVSKTEKSTHLLFAKINAFIRSLG